MSVRYVRMAKPPLDVKQVGYSILVENFTTSGPAEDNPDGLTWDVLGYVLDSYSDDHEPYVP